MKNKILLIFITLLLFNNVKITAQTYYNPKEEININLIIKEPFKPVNYAEIGKNFNNMLQQEAARREALKRYYDQIYFDTKSSISTNTYLTDDNTLNQKILLLQSTTLEHLDILNLNLKNGILKPQDYEIKIKNAYYTYININQSFLNINRYYYLKSNETKEIPLINKFNNNFKEAINSINKFTFTDYGVEFNLAGLVYPNCTSSNLYTFITKSCEGFIDTFKSNWNIKQQKLLEENNKKQEFINEWNKARLEGFELRTKLINNLTNEQAEKFRKLERKQVINFLEKIKKQDPEFKQINPKKTADYWMTNENEKHEFVNLLKKGDNEPLDYTISRTLIGIILYIQNNIKK